MMLDDALDRQTDGQTDSQTHAHAHLHIERGGGRSLREGDSVSLAIRVRFQGIDGDWGSSGRV